MENKIATSTIIEAISNGTNPLTGEVLPEETLYREPAIVSALKLALAAVRKIEYRELRKKNLPVKAGMSWDAAEDQRLLEGHDSGLAVAQIAERHERSKGSIISRLVKFGRLDQSATIGQARYIPQAVKNTE